MTSSRISNFESANLDEFTVSKETHGFFNHGRGNNEYYDKTTTRMLAFLTGLGYLAAAR